MKDREGHQINARAREKLLLESYRCAAGPASVLPEHSREEYQIGVSLNFPREYSYRGDRHAIPVGTISVLHPGKTHSARAPRDRQTPASFRMMYADPTLLRQPDTRVYLKVFVEPA